MVDIYIVQKLKELIKNPATRMKNVGHNTWIITTTTDSGDNGVAMYDDSGCDSVYVLQKENSQLKDQLHRRNMMIKALKASLNPKNPNGIMYGVLTRISELKKKLEECRNNLQATTLLKVNR